MFTISQSSNRDKRERIKGEIVSYVLFSPLVFAWDEGATRKISYKKDREEKRRRRGKESEEKESSSRTRGEEEERRERKKETK